MRLLKIHGLRRRPAARTEERRREPRYSPVVDQARLGWWEGERFRVAAARLRNISNGGAALTVAGDAPVAPPVWMSVVTPGQKEWVLAKVAGITDAEPGAHCVRLAFVEPCPKVVFEAAVRGATPPPPVRTPEPLTWRPGISPRIRRKRRDLPCQHGAWGGPVQQQARLDGDKRRWSSLFDYLKYF